MPSICLPVQARESCFARPLLRSYTYSWTGAINERCKEYVVLFKELVRWRVASGSVLWFSPQIAGGRGTAAEKVYVHFALFCFYTHYTGLVDNRPSRSFLTFTLMLRSRLSPAISRSMSFVSYLYHLFFRLYSNLYIIGKLLRYPHVLKTHCWLQILCSLSFRNCATWLLNRPKGRPYASLPSLPTPSSSPISLLYCQEISRDSQASCFWCRLCRDRVGRKRICRISPGRWTPETTRGKSRRSQHLELAGRLVEWRRVHGLQGSRGRVRQLLLCPFRR